MKFDFLKNKVFIISFIVLILFSFCFFTNSVVNASTFESTMPDVIKNKCFDVFNSHYNSNDYSFFVAFLKDSKGGYYHMFVYPNSYGNCIDIRTLNDGLKGIYFTKQVFGDVWFIYTDTDKKPTCQQNYNFCSGWCSSIYDVDISKYLLYGNEVTYFGDTGFFQLAPSISLKMALGQIPEIMTKIIKQVLPIGLIVLEIGLLIYLIRRVIYSMK